MNFGDRNKKVSRSQLFTNISIGCTLPKFFKNTPCFIIRILSTFLFLLCYSEILLHKTWHLTCYIRNLFNTFLSLIVFIRFRLLNENFFSFFLENKLIVTLLNTYSMCIIFYDIQYGTFEVNKINCLLLTIFTQFLYVLPKLLLQIKFLSFTNFNSILCILPFCKI